MATMIFCGDTMPTESNFADFIAGNRSAYLSDDLWEQIKNADFRFYNLEGVLCDTARPIIKCGPNLMAPTSAIKGIKELQPDLIGLANNHSLDHAKEGLLETINAFKKQGIKYTGVGETPSDAAKPFIYEKDGKKIGIYTCAEHEFSIAEEGRFGANPFDPFDTPDHIRTLKKECDFVVVIYHGCKEYYRYPSPLVRKACRKMVDCGADLVIGQHSHCVCCEERYKEGVIVYGQGNFVFDLPVENEYFETSILVKAEFGDKMEISYIPVRRKEKGVQLGEQEITDGFFARSEEIKVPGFVEKKYEEFALTLMERYLVLLSLNDGEAFTDEKLNKKMETPERYTNYHNSYLTIMENLFRCEAHWEIIITALHKMTQSGTYKEEK